MVCGIGRIPVDSRSGKLRVEDKEVFRQLTSEQPPALSRDVCGAVQETGDAARAPISQKRSCIGVPAQCGGSGESGLAHNSDTWEIDSGQHLIEQRRVSSGTSHVKGVEKSVVDHPDVVLLE